MINPKELRIGNLIYDEDYKIGKITRIDNDREFFHDTENKLYKCALSLNYSDWRGSLGKWLNKCHPIPLTEEWLLKFGFEKYEDIPWTYIKGPIKINAGNHFTIFVFDRSINQDCIPKIHQLQNLYFALTGEELKYN